MAKKKKSFLQDYASSVKSGVGRAAKGALRGLSDVTAAGVLSQPITATESGKTIYRALHKGKNPAPTRINIVSPMPKKEQRKYDQFMKKYKR